MLTLSKIKPAKGSVRQTKRVGRGNASGHGTYSTRGMKGQRSRSGVSGLKRLGMKPMLLNLPKKRGFKSLAPKFSVINTCELNDFFKEGAIVSPVTLAKAGLAEATKRGIKVLAKGDLKVKGLHFKNLTLSKTAALQVEKMGGKIE